MNPWGHRHHVQAQSSFLTCSWYYIIIVVLMSLLLFFHPTAITMMLAGQIYPKYTQPPARGGVLQKYITRTEPSFISGINPAGYLCKLDIIQIVPTTSTTAKPRYRYTTPSYNNITHYNIIMAAHNNNRTIQHGCSRYSVVHFMHTQILYS